MSAGNLPRIGADEAGKLGGKVLFVDIRSAAEYRREHIAEAVCIPAAELAVKPDAAANADTLVFYCLSGMRTAQAAATLAAAANGRTAYILDGGLQAWKKAGLPTIADRSAPLDIMRQVQIGAGSLVLLGVIGGAFLSPALYWLAAFVGAGLLTAGLTGFCGMAKILARMPWNRV